MIAGPVHAFNALISIDDLENLADESTGFLRSISILYSQDYQVAVGIWTWFLGI